MARLNVGAHTESEKFLFSFTLKNIEDHHEGAYRRFGDVLEVEDVQEITTYTYCPAELYEK